MSNLVAVDGVSKKIRKAGDVSAAERVMKLKNTSGPWAAIEEMVKIWAERSPGEFKGFKIHLDDIRETRIDPKFGRTRGKKMERRLILVLPQALQFMIRSVFKADELPFDRKFYREFARRFKMFRIPEKL